MGVGCSAGVEDQLSSRGAADAKGSGVSFFTQWFVALVRSLHVRASVSPSEESGDSCLLPPRSLGGGNEICRVSLLSSGDLTSAPREMGHGCPCPEVARAGVLPRDSQHALLGPTEKEKREKANQEGADVLGGGRQDSAPSLKSRES